ncbi:MAG: recombination protein O N-terminal domain-containing protein [Bacteroidia bacterium]|nr:recombination protein O N-terminal domain-containing protein [Bacteroidia bacterium]MDW8089559.1 recombination protein O N-terminal domain-containing protein [Bacteroidia bacterium]
MSNEVKTPALVLARYPYAEHSQVLHLYTEAEGRIAVLALGKRWGTLPPGALLRVCLRLRPHRELQRLSDAEWDYPYHTLFHDPQRYPYLALAIEWFQRCLLAWDPPLFAWIRAKLIELDTHPDPLFFLRQTFCELLERLGLGSLPSLPSLEQLEQVYQRSFSNWGPLYSSKLLEALSLPVYGNRPDASRSSFAAN